MNTYIQPEFTSKIDTKNIKTIFECGAKDCSDSIGIHNIYKGLVFAFEADKNHHTKNINRKEYLYQNGILLFDRPLALYSYSGKINFGSVNLDKSIDKNDGAGSILKLNYNRGWGPPPEIVQDFHEVECITIDDISSQIDIKPDMLCLDAQGSELEILKGGLNTLSNIQYIITEINYGLFYENMVLFDDINEFLTNNGFELVHRTGLSAFADALYRNMSITNAI